MTLCIVEDFNEKLSRGTRFTEVTVEEVVQLTQEDVLIVESSIGCEDF
jgi:hypothetical protein